MSTKSKLFLSALTLFTLGLGADNANNSQALGIGYFYQADNAAVVHYKPVFDVYNNGLYVNAMFETPHFSVLNSMFLTGDSLAAARGCRKAVKDFYGYTNQALVKINFSVDQIRQQVVIGRDYYQFGVGKTAGLFIGRESRPFDQLRWEYEYKALSGGLTAIQLENIGTEKRYLALHTFKFSQPDIIDLLVGEAILYSGTNRSFEQQYFNPFIFWMPEVVNNTTGDANGFLYGGLSFKMLPTWEFWGELLVDDYQINKEVKGDLEPNEIGFLAGVGKVAFPFPASQWFLEYTLVTNRTYQTPQLTETYTHRGYPIGHYLGNDFDLWQLHYEQGISLAALRPVFEKLSCKDIHLYCDVSYLRDGANGLDTPFDTPWEDSTVTMETGYSEPFPTRPITYVSELETGLDFYFTNGSYLNFGVFWQRQEFQGEVDYNYSLVLRLYLTLSKKFHY